MTKIDCPYREPIVDTVDDELAVCALLRQVSGVSDADLYRVKRDACLSCCQWHRSTESNLNPVVASLLYQLSDYVVQRDGVDGCDKQKGIALRDFAAENLPYDFDSPQIEPTSASKSEQGAKHPALLVPAPRKRYGNKVSKWAVGITTAPRQEPTLQRCVESLRFAGWDSPRLFVDGNVDLPSDLKNLEITHRSPQIGAWPNFFLSLCELYLREPTADAYMMVQDDSLFYRHAESRRSVEEILWPAKRSGIVSLYCSRAHTDSKSGWHPLKGDLLWGALALIFSREALLEFTSHPQVVRHRIEDLKGGLARIDSLLGQWACHCGFPIHIPTPGLVQHIGQTSSITQPSKAFGNRRSDCFAGDIDAMKSGETDSDETFG